MATHDDQGGSGAGAAPDSAQTSGSSGSSLRWLIPTAAVVAVVLSLALWTQRGGPAGGAAPDAAGSRLQRSLERYQEGRYEESLAEAQAALASDPSQAAAAYNNIAVSYLGLRRFDEALEAARQALRAQPGYELATNNLAWIEREKAEAARSLLVESLQHAQAGRFHECVDAATQSSQLDPQSANAFNNIGFCAGQLGQRDAALAALQTATRLDPNLQLARNNLESLQQEASAGVDQTPK